MNHLHAIKIDEIFLVQLLDCKNQQNYDHSTIIQANLKLKNFIIENSLKQLKVHVQSEIIILTEWFESAHDKMFNILFN